MRNLDSRVGDRKLALTRRNLTRAVMGAGAFTMLGGIPARAQQATPAAVSALDDRMPALLDAFVTEALETFAVPGAAIALVRDGRVVSVRGYGVRRLGDSAEVGPDTVFQLASNSKPMTAAALGALADLGALNFDTPVIELLPEFALSDPYATRNCTIRDLLAHRSGLPAFSGDLLGRLGYDRAEVLRRIRFIDIGNGFREAARYSNVGYFVAGEVLARVADADWETAMAEHLFGPLGLARTASMKSGPPADGDFAGNHALIDGVNTAIEWDDSVVFGAAGGVVSTANDMAAWMRMLLAQGSLDGTPVLAPETVGDLFEPSMVGEIEFSEMPPISEETGFDYGLGWGVFRFNGRTVLEKGGALGGVRTVVNLVPTLGLGIAVLANQNLTALPEAVRAFVLEQYLGAAAADTQDEIFARGQQLLSLFAVAPIPDDVQPASVPIDAFAGTYTNDVYGPIEIVSAGTALSLLAGPAAYPGTLQHMGYDTFLLTWPTVTTTGEQVVFTIGPDGVPLGFETESIGALRRA